VSSQHDSKALWRVIITILIHPIAKECISRGLHVVTYSFPRRLI